MEIQSLIGLNSNLTVGDRVLHIQTEDLGRRRACIVTHVFSKSGQVVRQERFEYTKHLGHPNLAHILPRAMQAQHVAVIQRLREEGASADLAISRTDLPCVRLEDSTPLPELETPLPRSTRVRLASGVWDRLVEQTKAEREKERAAAQPIPLPEPTPPPRLTPSTEILRREGVGRAAVNCWEAAVASARREFDETPQPEITKVEFPDTGISAQQAFDEAMACLVREETERALVLLCQAVAQNPWNATFRTSLARLLFRMRDR